MKLWDKGINTAQWVDDFTAGNDKTSDLHLAEYDVLGTLAHITMLESIHLLDPDELKILRIELIKIYESIKNGEFIIEPSIEDVHSQIEWLLTQSLGDIGKKVHSGRSRNDQVLLDLKLFLRSEIEKICFLTKELFDLLISLSNTYCEVLIPGYTHLQVAMPSSFGLFFGAYAESLVDDMVLLQAAYKLTNQNPLGSGAGYGSSFPLNRQMTTELLGFENMNYNVVYAQMSRGKTEKLVATALAGIAATLSRMSMDICLYAGQNYDFLSFPDALTTGSSIMPHKKNLDVFELIRAKCNKMQVLPNEIQMVMSNLPSGYHRDMQLFKEEIIFAFQSAGDCLQACKHMLLEIKINNSVIQDERYAYLFSVEAVNERVLQGMPFREAYQTVAKEIKEGVFIPNLQIRHTHEGSLGNLCNQQIVKRMEIIIEGFHFEKEQEAFRRLLKS
jgi:argininosuccinate lyase